MNQEKLPKLSIRFEAPFAEPHISIICNPPFHEVNLFFRACANNRIRPFQTAIEEGVVAKETSQRIYAALYAEAVIDRCEDQPYDQFTAEQWRVWLLENEDHFSELQAFVDCKANWKEAFPLENFDGVDRHLYPGAAA